MSETHTETAGGTVGGFTPPDGQPDVDTRDTADIADENARLRGELDAENQRLRAALADSQAQNADAQGLTDEDVRRIEHPEEYVD